MPLTTFLVIMRMDGGKAHREVVVADSPLSARAKAKERKAGMEVLHVKALHKGPPRG